MPIPHNAITPLFFNWCLFICPFRTVNIPGLPGVFHPYSTVLHIHSPDRPAFVSLTHAQCRAGAHNASHCVEAIGLEHSFLNHCALINFGVQYSKRHYFTETVASLTVRGFTGIHPFDSNWGWRSARMPEPFIGRIPLTSTVSPPSSTAALAIVQWTHTLVMKPMMLRAREQILRSSFAEHHVVTMWYCPRVANRNRVRPC